MDYNEQSEALSRTAIALVIVSCILLLSMLILERIALHHPSAIADKLFLPMIWLFALSAVIAFVLSIAAMRSRKWCFNPKPNLPILALLLSLLPFSILAFELWIGFGLATGHMH